MPPDGLRIVMPLGDYELSSAAFRRYHEVTSNGKAAHVLKAELRWETLDGFARVVGEPRFICALEKLPAPKRKAKAKPRGLAAPPLGDLAADGQDEVDDAVEDFVADEEFAGAGDSSLRR